MDDAILNFDLDMLDPQQQQQPHLQQPHLQQPHPGLQQPQPRLQQPHPGLQQPRLQQPHPGLQQPQPHLQQPHPGLQHPGLQQPQPHLQQPHPGLQQPRLQQPQPRLQHNPSLANARMSLQHQSGGQIPPGMNPQQQIMRPQATPGMTYAAITAGGQQHSLFIPPPMHMLTNPSVITNRFANGHVVLQPLQQQVNNGGRMETSNVSSTGQPLLGPAPAGGQVGTGPPNPVPAEATAYFHDPQQQAGAFLNQQVPPRRGRGGGGPHSLPEKGEWTTVQSKKKRKAAKVEDKAAAKRQSLQALETHWKPHVSSHP